MLVVVAVAAAVRLVAIVAWAQHQEPAGDEAFYWRQAGYLAGGDGFVYRNNAGELVRTAVHPPAYSAVLALVDLVPGLDGHVWHRLLTATIGTAAAAVIAVVAMRLASWRAGLVAGLLAAVQPNLWFNDVKLTAESLFALAVGLVLVASYDLVARPTTRRAVVLAAAIGFATLVRAEALFLFVLLLVPLVLRAADTSWRDRLVRVGWAALAMGAVCAPWVLRNLVAFERPATLSSGSGFVIEISNCDPTYGLSAPVGPGGAVDPAAPTDEYLGYWTVDCDRSSVSVYGEEARPWPVGDETVAEAEKRSIGLAYVRAHLDRLPIVLAARVGRIWDVWRPQQGIDFNVFFERRDATTEVLGRVVRWQAVATWLHLASLPVALAGGIVLWRRRITVLPFVALALSATLTAAVSFGITRYRVGADVGLIVLVGVATAAAWEALVRRRSTHAEPTEVSGGVPASGEAGA